MNTTLFAICQTHEWYGDGDVGDYSTGRWKPKGADYVRIPGALETDAPAALNALIESKIDALNNEYHGYTLTFLEAVWVGHEGEIADRDASGIQFLEGVLEFVERVIEDYPTLRNVKFIRPF